MKVNPSFKFERTRFHRVRFHVDIVARRFLNVRILNQYFAVTPTKFSTCFKFSNEKV